MKTKRTYGLAIALTVAAGVAFTGVGSVAAVSATITSYTTPVHLTFEGGRGADAALITLKTAEADQLLMYCIDLNTHTSSGVTYDEGSWTQANVPDVAKVTAILQASYPVRTLAQLQQQPPTLATLTEQEAIAGTQAAIWHFSDLVNLDRTTAAQDPSSNIGRLYDYLLAKAANPIVEPVPGLAISPSTLSATSGTRVGPFTLQVSPPSATAAVTNDAGAVFTDRDGNSLVPTADGQLFWVTPSAEGTFHITATVRTAVPTGRVFLHTSTPTDPDAHQKLVVAKSSEVTASATASFESTPVPTTTTEAPTTTTEAPATTTEAPATTSAPTTDAPTPTATLAPTLVATAEQAVVVATLPVLSTTTQPTALQLSHTTSLPATGSSSPLPKLVLAAGTLLLGIVLTSTTRRRRVLR